MLPIYLSFAYQCSMKMAIINSLNMFQYSPVFVDKQILLCNCLEVKFLVQVFLFFFCDVCDVCDVCGPKTRNFTV